jgi:hypothetical protein
LRRALAARRPAAVALLGAACLALGAARADAALIEPVTVTATGPGTVVAGTPFKLEVLVEAEANALSIAAQPLHLRVKFAPECGGSFAGTPGPAALDQVLPAPSAAAYKQNVVANVTAAGSGAEVVCTFLEDSTERQFATDTEEEVTVLTAAEGAARKHQCTAATKQIAKAKRQNKRLARRIKKVKRLERHAAGAHRKALAHKLHTLRAHQRKVAKRRKAAVKTAAGSCS